MKHALSAPILSALVLPGLGQVINRQIAKGVILIFLVTVLFLGSLLKLGMEISAAMNQVIKPDFSFDEKFWIDFLNAFKAQDHTLLFLIVIAGIMIWAFSVVDAFISGRKFDAELKEGG